jgi:hypothetical protein
MPANEPAYPVDVVFLGAQAVMEVAQTVPKLVEEADRGQSGPVMFAVSVNTVHSNSICRQSQAASGSMPINISVLNDNSPC